MGSESLEGSTRPNKSLLEDRSMPDKAEHRDRASHVRTPCKQKMIIDEDTGNRNQRQKRSYKEGGKKWS